MPDIRPRWHVDPALWDAFTETHPYGWWWHRWAWLEYEACRPGVEDASVAVFNEDGRLVALSPVLIEDHAIQAAGEPVAMPLGCVCEAIEPGSAITRARWRAWPGAGEVAIPPHCTDISWQTRVVDLGVSEDALFHGLKKSNRAGRTNVRGDLAGRFGVMQGPGCVEKFHEIHRLGAGRETRLQRTWDLMEAWVRERLAECYIAINSIGDAMAGIYVFAWKGYVYYGSSSTLVPRENVTALLLWRAMLDMKARGCRWFELGWQARPGDDAKARSIAAFKTGFGGVDIPQRAWEWRANT